MKLLRESLERKKRGEKGFSFIELVIVVAVIGILTSIAIPAYGGIQSSAKQAAVDANAQTGYKLVAATTAGFGVTTANFQARTIAATPAPGSPLAALDKLSTPGEIELKLIDKAGTPMTNIANDYCVWAYDAREELGDKWRYNSLVGACPAVAPNRAGVVATPEPEVPVEPSPEPTPEETETPEEPVGYSITTKELPQGMATVRYSFVVESNESASTFTATGLPSGLTINSTTGLIAGFTSAVGTHEITVNAAVGTARATEKTFTLIIAPYTATTIYNDNFGADSFFKAGVPSTSYDTTQTNFAPVGTTRILGPTTTLNTTITPANCKAALSTLTNCARITYSAREGITSRLVGVRMELEPGKYIFNARSTQGSASLKATVASQVIATSNQPQDGTYFTRNSVEFTLTEAAAVDLTMDYSVRVATGSAYIHFGHFDVLKLS